MGDNEGGPLAKFQKYANSPKILWKGWTMPANEALVTVYPEDDRSTARQAALGVIVFLMLCLKDSPTIESVVGAVIGAALTYSLNLWVKSKEPELISAYGLVIVVILCAIVLPIFIWSTVIYEPVDRLLKYSGISRATNITPVVFGMFVAFAAWYLKARFLDHNKIGGQTLAWAAETAVFAGVIVGLVAGCQRRYLVKLAHRCRSGHRLPPLP